jgi:hypothetical protein
VSEPRPASRRDLLKPVQLLGLAFAAAAFAGIVTLVSMGFFQSRPADELQRVVIVALIVAGISFIVTLVGLALLLLAVDPSQVTKTVDRPVLLADDHDDDPGSAGRRRGGSPTA